MPEEVSQLEMSLSRQKEDFQLRSLLWKFFLSKSCWGLCVCVCVCERERQRDRETEREFSRNTQAHLSYHHAIYKVIIINLSSIWFRRNLIDFPGGSDGKASAYNVGDLGSIPGLGRFPREGNGNPLQYSRLENPMDREAS